MLKITVLLVISIIIIGPNVFAEEENFEYIDKIYDQDIKTVRLFPMVEDPNRERLAAAAPLNGGFSLVLQFDHLFAEYETYFVKFIHCNANWSPSRLFPLDYLEDFNEFRVQEYEFSFNTRVPYVHYQYVLPRFKIPGNYLLVVYRDSEENVVLTKRFMIYDNQILLSENQGNSGVTNVSRMNQEIQFSLKYSGRNLDNPYKYIKATIRQNQRWDNAIYSLPPSFVNEASRDMEFRQFAGENQFRGGNQFRYFDLQDLRYFGRNVETVDLKAKIPIATLEQDATRGTESYAENDDQNGKYLISHPFESDYAYVQFFLNSNQINDEVYLAGDFSLWAKDDTYKMEYIKELKSYYAVFMMKQGIYDYQYLVEGDNTNENYFEGDHFQTENEYEILIYYYSFQLDVDLLIGYFTMSRNPRY
jgi:hypothetical protein